MRYNISLLVGILVCFVSGCDKQKTVSPAIPDADSEAVLSDKQIDREPRSEPTFLDHGMKFELASDCGVHFQYYGNPSPEHYMTEQNGGGVAVFDFDVDGRMDLFFANGSHFHRSAESVGAFHHLYRNVLQLNGQLQFIEVAKPAEIQSHGFGMGVATADFNNDGFPDLLICEYGKVHLWENLGDGTWEDVTEGSRIKNDAWGAAAAWGDLDEDGDLDLYLVNYVEYKPTDPPCFTQHATPVQISCGPIGRVAQEDVLWINQNDGTFIDESTSSGIRHSMPGKGLAVEIVDLNGDHKLDIYVANDTTENFLFLNEGGGHFQESGLLSGTALSSDGGAGSSMGIACADFDKNGRFDLFVTNFENAINDYYSNQSDGIFLHTSAASGLDTTSRPMLAFGTVAADFNLDRWPDMFVANGHIWDLRDLGFGHEYEMTPQLFYNNGNKRFIDVSATSGDFFEEKWLGRSAAAGDLDNDGDLDLVISNQIREAAIVENSSQHKGSSMTLRFVGTQASRQPLGVRVTSQIGETIDHYHIQSGGSFAASQDDRLIISLGDANAIDELTIYWDSQTSERWTNLTARSAILVQGTGTPLALP